ALANRRDGSLLFATEGGTVLRYASSKLAPFAVENAARHDVSSFYEDPDGLLWMGTLGSGLRLVDGQRLVRISVGEGLFDDEISAVVPDDLGRLWMACSKGLFYVERADLLKFARGEIKAV